jgi:hypothetical protein
MAAGGRRAGRALGSQRDDRRRNPLDRAQRLFGRLAHRLGLGGRGGIDEDRQIDLAFPLRQSGDRPRSGQRRPAVGPVDRAKRFGDRILVNQNPSPWINRPKLVYIGSFGSVGI